MANNKKYTDNFKATIEKKLNEVAAENPLFANNLAKPEKNIDDCINYILKTVKDSGVQGFTDSEIYNMAMHYYDEDDIKDLSPLNCHVVVNHTVQLTEQEIAEAKEKAREKIFNEERKKLMTKQKPAPAPSSKPKEATQATLF